MLNSRYILGCMHMMKFGKFCLVKLLVAILIPLTSTEILATSVVARRHDYQFEDRLNAVKIIELMQDSFERNGFFLERKTISYVQGRGTHYSYVFSQIFNEGDDFAIKRIEFVIVADKDGLTQFVKGINTDLGFNYSTMEFHDPKLKELRRTLERRLIMLESVLETWIKSNSTKYYVIE